MITEQGTVPQISGKLQNYPIVTYSRYVNINWDKVDIIASKKEHGKLIAGLPHPFDKARIRTTGKVLGEEIDINLTSCKAIKERLIKARQSWRIPRRRIFAGTTLKTEQS